jgi:prolyl oligopeptidase
MKRNIIMALATMTTMAVEAQGLVYPEAVKDNTVDEYFGTKVSDPYRWLEDDRSARTTAWVEAENRVTNDFLSRIPFRQKVLKRLTELANYEKIGAPRKRHGKWYFYKNDGLQNQSVLYQMDKLGGTPHVFLDPNALSPDGTVALKGVYF